MIVVPAQPQRVGRVGKRGVGDELLRPSPTRHACGCPGVGGSGRVGRDRDREPGPVYETT